MARKISIKWWHTIVAFALGLMLVLTTPYLPNALGQVNSDSNDSASGVVLGEETLFTIEAKLNNKSPAQRAELISRNIERIAKDPSIPVNSLQVGNQNGTTVIFANETVIARISTDDAIAAERLPQDLASSYLEKIRKAIPQYREDNGLNVVVEVGSQEWFLRLWRKLKSLPNRDYNLGFPTALLYTFIATVVLISLLIGIKLAYAIVSRFLSGQIANNVSTIEFQGYHLLSAKQVSRVIFLIVKAIRLGLNLVVIYIYTATVLSFFTVTRRFSSIIFSYLFNFIYKGWEGFLAYLPNIFIIVVIVAITSYVLGWIKPIFDKLGTGEMSISGFYTDWAQPTYRLLAISLICLAGVMTMPYLPGFGSPAFNGVSVFVGVLFSLGSSSSLTNAIAGIILIYARPFQLGDRVIIDDIEGNVEEKTLLVTRIRTDDNSIITIPNGTVMGGNITNFHTSVREMNEYIAISAKVGLGYEIPWQQAYAILTEAGLRTDLALRDPSPEVEQKELADFAVVYEVKVGIEDPDMDGYVHSELLKNIRDVCDEAGVEILKPHYSALRDGNHTTLPKDKLPHNYKAPGFQLNPLGNLFQIDLNWGSKQHNGKHKTKPVSQQRSPRPKSKV